MPPSELRIYDCLIGSDKFVVTLDTGHQGARSESAKMFIKKYNLPGSISTSWVAQEAHTFVRPDYATEISSDALIDFLKRKAGKKYGPI